MENKPAPKRESNISSKIDIPAAFGAAGSKKPETKAISPRPKPVVEKKVEQPKPVVAEKKLEMAPPKKVEPKPVVEKKIDPKPVAEKKVEPAKPVEATQPKQNELSRKSTKIEIPSVFGAASNKSNTT